MTSAGRPPDVDRTSVRRDYRRVAPSPHPLA